MKTQGIVTILLLSFATALFASTNVSTNERLIIGTWAGTTTRGDFHMRDEKTFYSDGTASGWIKIWQRTPDGKETLKDDVTFKSRWRIEGVQIIAYDIRTQPKDALDPNEVIHDTILSIDNKEFRFKTDDGEVYVYRRVK